MQADDIAAYFMKKIAKPIAFDLLIDDGSHRGNHRFYAIEPTAVRDSILHVLVSLKYETFFGDKKARSEHIGEVSIPFEDGDTIEEIYDMVIAGTDSASGRYHMKVVGAPEKLSAAYEKLSLRLDIIDAATPKP